MLKIAVLEKESVAKDLIFECAKMLNDMEWTFSHFTKISEFAKAEESGQFDVVFFHELFYTPRVSASFVERFPQRIVIYCMEQLSDMQKEIYPMNRILFIQRRQVKSEMMRIKEHLHSLLRSHKDYLLSYNGLLIAIRIQDIYYIEKSNKNLIFHTVRGVFKERKTMMKAEEYFKNYDFLRIHASFLVNVQHIVKIQNDMIELHHQETLPIARARKKEIIDWFHAYVKAR